LTLASCCGNPIKRNSVLDGLRLRQLEVIQDEIEAIFLCIQDCALEKFQDEKKYKAECDMHISDTSYRYVLLCGAAQPKE